MARRREDKKDNFEEKVLDISRVSRTVKGGKRISFRALVVVGDRNGSVGVGIGKSTEVSGAIRKGASQARKKLHKIKTDEKGTILREVNASYSSSKVMMRPAPEGTSIIAGGVVRAVAELAGVRNLVAKLYGSNNKINTARAALNALKKASKNVN